MVGSWPSHVDLKQLVQASTHPLAMLHSYKPAVVRAQTSCSKLMGGSYVTATAIVANALHT